MANRRPVIRRMMTTTTSNDSRKRFVLPISIPWRTQRKLWAYVFIGLPFLYILISSFGAMLASFSFSFLNYNTLSTARSWAGLENYKEVLTDPEFYQALKNSLMFGVIRVPVTIVLSLGAALLLSNVQHFKGFFRLLFFIPFVTSGVAISWVFKFMYLPNFGLFSKITDFLDLPRVDFLGMPQTALYAIAFVSIWASMGFYTLIFLAGLEDIPGEFYDAAKVDGASSWQRFWQITLPLLNRTLVLAVVLCLISSLQTFTLVKMLSADNGFGGPLGASRTLPIMIYREAFFYNNMGTAATMSVLFFIIILVMSLVQRRLLTREVDY